MRKLLMKIFIVVLLLFCLVWVASILKCEILTYQYGNQFKVIYQENTMIGEIEYLKVLNYSDFTAKVYYVSKNRSGGDTVEFHKEKNKWCYSNWNTVWSKTGSADGFIWPYIR